MLASTFTRTVVTTAGAALFATICLTSAVAPAAAAPANPYVNVSKSVSHAGLNLDTASGRAILDARIKAATKSVCNSGSNDLRSRAEEQRCIRNIVVQTTRS